MLWTADVRSLVQPALHRVIAVDSLQVPRPFDRFAVRSDEPRHAWDARAPYRCVHAVHTTFLPPPALAALAADGDNRVPLEEAGVVHYAATSFAQLHGALAEALPDLPPDLPPDGVDIAAGIANALQQTGVLGDDPRSYQQAVAARIDYLASCGAGFHNDVSGHWSRCLFWVLALAADDVEFVMPHAGLRLALAPGDLLLFDQTLAHGLCRPADAGQAVAASFQAGVHSRQVFLTGELPLSDAQWAHLGAPWLPVDAPAHHAALDLMVAEFDDRSGHIKRPHTLRLGMQRSTCHVDDGAG